MDAPIDIHLRFQAPQEVLVLLEALGQQAQEARDMVADDKRADAAYMQDMNELEQAVWVSLMDQGFEFINRPGDYVKVKYQGEILEYKRRPIVEAVTSGPPV
jgi:hypothetical protein